MGTHPIFESDFDCLTEMTETLSAPEKIGPPGSRGLLRRNRPGTKRADWCNWPDQEFNQMESIHSQQMLIQQRIRNNRMSIQNILSPPEGADEDVWKYEHLRQFCQELNGLATRLQVECTPQSCPQMTATDQWIFLCAAHKSPKECSAIDYTRHTLDGAAILLNSHKYFPSRVSLRQPSVTKLGSISRRIYRIFSHAYFHHKHIFLDFENQFQLCRRFTVFVTSYNLMPADNLIVPVDSLESGIPTMPTDTTNQPISEQNITSSQTEIGDSSYSTATIARAEPKIETKSEIKTEPDFNCDETVIDSQSEPSGDPSQDQASQGHPDPKSEPSESSA